MTNNLKFDSLYDLQHIEWNNSKIFMSKLENLKQKMTLNSGKGALILRLENVV